MFDKLVNKIKEVTGQKIDLTDVTFIIPVRIDCKERLENAQITINYLLKYFNTTIILTENGPKSNWDKFGFGENPNLQYIFQKNKNPLFHKTKILNDMLAMVKTKVTATYDSDALLPVQSYVAARDAILNQGYHYVGSESTQSKRFTIGDDLKPLLKKNLNLNSLPKNKLTQLDGARFGLAVFSNTKSYREIGGENENFISWGWEDIERTTRFCKAGYKAGLLKDTPMKGNTYHLSHPRTVNSSRANPHYKTNENVFGRTKKFFNTKLHRSIEEVAALCEPQPKK